MNTSLPVMATSSLPEQKRLARREGLVAFWLSAGLTLAGFALLGDASRTGQTVSNFIFSAACVLSWVAILRIFQGLGPAPNTQETAFMDHSAIMLATVYFAWIMVKVVSLW